MADLDKELDFNDIAGKKTQTKSEKTKNVVPGRSVESTGTVLSIPTDDPNAWICKDLADVTSEEFVAWAQSVYPVDLSHAIDAFHKLSRRIQMFKTILYYHTTSLFQTGKSGEKNTTKH